MASHYTSAMTTPSSSATGTLKRTVSDTIRHLFPGNPLMALISSGLATSKQIVKEKALLQKRRVETPKYECFTYTPLAIEFTVATFTDVGSSSGFTVSSADGLRPKMCLMNTANFTVCRIGTITSTTLRCTTIGDTAFTASIGDKLLVLAPAYEENSSSPYILMKDDDNLYNLTTTSRFAVAVSRSAKGNPHYGGMYYKNIKEKNAVEGLRKVELAALFSQRPSSTNETTTDSLLSDTVRTTRGIWNWHAGTFPCGGSMTYNKYMLELPLAMDSTVGTETKLIQFSGTKIKGLMMQWLNDTVRTEPGEYKLYGVRSTKFMTAKGDIEVITHDAFDRGSMNKCALIFCPDDLEYVHLRDDDFKAKNGIQANDVDGEEDEIIGEWGINPTDGGKKILRVTEWWS
jgi:hypothetical protein